LPGGSDPAASAGTDGDAANHDRCSDQIHFRSLFEKLPIKPNINLCPDVLLSNIARICPLPSAIAESVEAQEPPAQNSQIP
jgi:hypothetical protein